jgi:hypothetical protein
MYTEKETLIKNEQSTFYLKNLYLKDKKLFNQLTDFLQNPIFINHRENFKYHFFYKSFFSYGQEEVELYAEGHSYVSLISGPYLFQKKQNRGLSNCKKSYLC